MRDTILNTNAFKNLSPRTQNIIRKTSNVASIQHDIAVIKNIGYPEWNRISNVSNVNRRIIDEILENENEP